MKSILFALLICIASCASMNSKIRLGMGIDEFKKITVINNEHLVHAEGNVRVFKVFAREFQRNDNTRLMTFENGVLVKIEEGAIGPKGLENIELPQVQLPFLPNFTRN